MFQLADGTISRPLGYCEQTVSLAGKQVTKQRFWCLHTLPMSVIIGTDFFQRTGTIIDFAEQSITMRVVQKEPLLFFGKKQTHTPVVKDAVQLLRLCNNLTLQPGTQTLVEVSGPKLSGLSGMTERAGQGERHATAMASCITKARETEEDSRMWVSIANLTTHPSRLKKDTVVGIFNTVITDVESRPQHNMESTYSLHQPK